ncbi:cell division protein SepF [Spiroplasma endosymbiont of Crioceris asparagi]|uniref:cell division protein SepF n=1 Tax=Spiroplasma endosymbiont of Crioceris asparagi TaxID=3066286 RepID=UPI0030D418FB
MDENNTFDTSRLTHFKPEAYSEVKQIVHTLKKFKSVSVNFDSLSKEEKTRVIDFMLGAMFALDGAYHKVTKSIYVFDIK